MPDEKPATSPTPSPTPASSTGAATTSPTPTTIPVQEVEFRYKAGPGIPDYLVGKTANEAATQFQQIYQQAIAAQGTQQANTYQPPTPPPPQAPSSEVAQYLDSVRQRELTPAFQRVDASLVQMARATGALQYPDEFRRWGPEIDMYISQFNASSPQSVAVIVDMVRGRHVNELAEEVHKKKLDALIQGGTLRPQSGDSQGGEGAAYRIDFEQLPPNYARLLKNLGATPEDVDALCRSAYPDMPLPKARERWMKAAQKGDVITDGFRYVQGGSDVA